MRSYYYNFFLIISRFSISLATESEDKEDIGKSLVLIRNGEEYHLPICVTKMDGEIYYTMAYKEFTNYFCPPEVPLTGEYENCLVPFEAKLDECKKRVEPIIAKVIGNSDKSHKSCFKSLGKLYQFAFHPCKQEKTISGEETGRITRLRNQIMYAICYDHNRQRVLRVARTLHSPLLLNNNILKTDREKEYKISTTDFGLFDSIFQTLQKSYSEELEKGEMEMQYIVPPEQIAFSVWKRSVYHYINTQLVFKQTAKILKHTDNFIKEQAEKLLGEIHVSDSFEFSNTGIIKIWSKTVYDETLSSALVIIIHNATEKPSQEDKLCSKSICSLYGWEGAILNNFDSYIYCCETKEVATRFDLISVKKVINLNSKWKHFFKSSHHRQEFWREMRC